MWPLRQRLLLIAGWAIAAVATGLVSAGAVAVAGGQVNDRPLRPLSAAEVAALPVTIEDACVMNGPLASGGPGSDVECPDRQPVRGQSEPGDSDAQPAEREFASVTRPVAPGAIDDLERTSSARVVIPDVGERASQPVAVSTRGGRVSVGADRGSVVFHSATPRPGYIADVTFEGTERITVTFWNGTELSTVVAGIGPDDRLTIDRSESTS